MAARHGRARRWAALAALPAAIAAGAVLVLCGAFQPGTSAPLARVAAWLLLLGAGAAAARRQLRFALRSGGPRAPLAWSAEAALLLVLGAFALIQASGGPRGPLEPLLYLLGAGFALSLPLPLSAGLLAAMLALDLAQLLALPLAPAAASPPHLLAALRLRWPEVASHVGFTLLFAGLYHALLSARLRWAERAEREAVGLRVAEAEERARELRLVVTADGADAAPEGEAARADQRRLLAAVGEVEEALRGALAVAEAALQPRTVAVFLVGESGETVRLRESLSSSDLLVRTPLPLCEGALGAVLSSGRPVRLDGSGPPLSYYRGEPPSAAFCGVPLRARRARPRLDPAERDTQPPGPDAGQGLLVEGPMVGALIADRDLPFSEGDERTLVALAAEVVRAIDSERLLADVRREKEEKARFFRALEDLNTTRAVSEAAETAVRYARQMCPALDLCAITAAEDSAAEGRGPRGAAAPRRRVRHRVVAVAGAGTSALQDLTFADDRGVVADVVKLGHPLPGRDYREMEQPVVIFDRATKVSGLSALKVFPLITASETLGTLVCGSRDPDGLPEGAQQELARLALQAAAAMARTRAFEQVERLATTDGLTGLLNRRTLNEQLAARIREAQRYNHPLSFLLLDIDHFKKVNDTHGHPAGDAVLRGVAAVAQAQARETDAVARYGGEEIALVLPETDAAGARAIAERLRAGIEASAHATDRGPLRCTASIGVATFAPGEGAADAAALLEAADGALYRAKRSGRNRVECAPARVAA